MKTTSLFFLVYCLCFSATALYSQSEYVTCNNAQFLCDKAPLFIPNIAAAKADTRNAPTGSCFQPDFTETNVIWLKWQVAKPGDLAFTILPIADSDDIDFVLYRMSSLENCTDKEVVRCMAAGPNLGNSERTFTCTGATGLRSEASVDELKQGCPETENNFLRPVELQSGEYYALYISNFRSSGGIAIEWGGSATFLPVPEVCSPRPATFAFGVPDAVTAVRFSAPFPSPGSDIVRIQANSTQEQAGQMFLISAEGDLKFVRPFSLSSGESTLEIPIENLQSGVYFLKMKTGSEISVLRFVKH